MSLANRDLASAVCPVPEDLLDGKTPKEQRTALAGHLSFNRLKDQEEALASHVDRRRQAAVPPGASPPRPFAKHRAPASNDVKPVKAHIPRDFKSLGSFTPGNVRVSPAPKVRSASSSAPIGVKRESIHDIRNARPRTAGGTRAHATAAWEEPPAGAGRPRSASAARPGSASRPGPAPAPAPVQAAGRPAPARAPSPPQAPQQEELDPSFQSQLQRLIARQQGRAKRGADFRNVASRSPSEGIGALMSPSAQVRTAARNARMLHPASPRPGPPAPAAPAPAAPMEQPLAPDAAGVLGSDPALSQFLPLEEFDNDELDMYTPQQWVARGRASGHPGTEASSKFHFEGGAAHWAPCWVLVCASCRQCPGRHQACQRQGHG